MEQDKAKKKLYHQLLKITLLPIFLLTAVIITVSIRSYVNAMNNEVRQGLMNQSFTIITMYDKLYPGDYKAFEGADGLYLLKGDHLINGDFSIIDTLKENTGVDITVFYQDVRVITTVRGEDGERIIGTKVSAVVVKDVLEGGRAAFYPNVSIGDKNYFAYYSPLLNEDGACIGMLFVAKPVETVMNDLFRVILPIVFLGILAVMIAALLTIRYSCRLTEAIGEIEKFLGKVANGELNEQLAYPVGKRKDEVGELGRHAVDMQRSLRELVEKDALTGLYNRRYGEKRLKQVQKDADSYGMPFCIAIGDIDHFKHVNDTYGHEWGDRVLTQIARIMAERMRREGYAARWGGEEFLLVFIDQGLQDAAETLRKLQNEIRDTEFTYNEKEKIRVTMTFGICESYGGNTDELLRCADNRLYAGKKGGRDRIIQE